MVKLSRKSNPCLHLHTLLDGDGWLVWDLKLNREVKTHDVIFHENDFPGLGQISGKTHSNWFSWSLDKCDRTQDLTAQGRNRALWERRLSASIHIPMNQSPQPDQNVTKEDDSHVHTDKDININEDGTAEQDEVDPTHPSPSPEPAPPPVQEPRRGSRLRTKPDRYGFLAKTVIETLRHDNTTPLLCALLATRDPQSFKEAVASQHKDKWLTAMQKEIDSLIEKHMFDLVPLPKNKKAIGCRWTYKSKYLDGVLERHKARIVAKFYLQKKGVDFEETYAPSTRAETIRLVMTHMVKEAWESRQMDVMAAFLKSMLPDEVYLKQPEGFSDKTHPTWVWRVRASLYGLRQAPREWITTLTNKLLSDGLQQSKHNLVLFIKKEEGKVTGVVLAHIDDLYFTGEKSFVKKKVTNSSQPSKCQSEAHSTPTSLSKWKET